MTEAYPQQEFDRNPPDKCGVVGIWVPEPGQRQEGQPGVAELTMAGMVAVQHRGYDGAGIFVIDSNHNFPFMGTSGQGDVQEALNVYGPNCTTLDQMVPNAQMGVGHTRYGTNDAGGLDALGPFLWGDNEPPSKTTTVDVIDGVPALEEFVLAHNGHVDGVAAFNESDTQAITHEIGRYSKTRGEDGEYMGVLGAIHKVCPTLEGAFSLVIGTHGQPGVTYGQLIGVRDPEGYRPLLVGHFEDSGGFMFASERPALERAGATYLRNLLPGEVMSISEKGVQSTLLDRPQSQHGGLCIMEEVYFARMDGALEGRELQAVRIALGRELARERPAKADVVVGIPESGRPIAQGFAEELGIPLVEGISLNRDAPVKRSFMAGTQLKRDRAARDKLLIMRHVLRGKRVALVDDSGVRGTAQRNTAGRVIQEGGATEVHGRLGSAPLVNACRQGMAFGDPRTLIAHRLGSIEAVRKELNLDSLGYLSVAGMMRAIESVPVELGPAHLQHLVPLPKPEGPLRRCTTCMGGPRAVRVPIDREIPLLPELKH